jgi:hypothetical protein
MCHLTPTFFPTLEPFPDKMIICPSHTKHHGKKIDISASVGVIFFKKAQLAIPNAQYNKLFFYRERLLNIV